MTEIRWLDETDFGECEQVGSKALALGLFARAGFPVPDGFCITSAAYRRLEGRLPSANDSLREEIACAYQRLGGLAVAVRSSSTDEDALEATFAGQLDSFLDISGVDAVLDAVGRCWASLRSARVLAYRRRQGLAEHGAAMAVLVQRLVRAQIAGVLFTRDPLRPEEDHLVIEAAPGPGSAVVSGKITPARYSIERATRTVLARELGARQDAPLHDARIAELVDLGLRIEALVGASRDIEWAWASDQFWVLQARPITAAQAARERDTIRRDEVAALRSQGRGGVTAWARFHLAEVLPEPTPMSWAIIQRLVAPAGGLGLMYRDLGFTLDSRLGDCGPYDLVCGRTYCCLGRETLFYANGLPLAYDLAALRADPATAADARPRLDMAGGLGRLVLTLPLLLARSARAKRRLAREADTFAVRFRERIVPSFARAVDEATRRDLSSLDAAGLGAFLESWIQRTLVDFARDSLKPAVLAGHMLSRIEAELGGHLGPERGRALARGLMAGVRPARQADVAGAIALLARGDLSSEQFIRQFGHRAGKEMELAAPRWAEDPDAPERLAKALGASTPRPVEDPRSLLGRIADQLRLAGPRRARFEALVESLHEQIRLRELGKHHFMAGYALIRRALVELDRRHGLAGGIFFLLPEEMASLGRRDVSQAIRGRLRRRSLALTLEVPALLFSDDLEAIGRPATPRALTRLRGVPVSGGVARGPALVLEDPHSAAVPDTPYVLVCPAADPAWAALLAGARGLVTEAGGLLSHGAIVAREFGVPAVAGVTDACRTLRNGQQLHVDGGTGTILVLADDH
jgi:pyruvate,water dikinase